MQEIAFQWLGFVPGLLAAAVAMALAVAWRERSPLASTLLIAGLAIRVVAPIVFYATMMLMELDVWVIGAASGVVSLVAGFGSVLCVAAATVGRPRRTWRDDEVAP